jgi:5-methylcytosine-specific restriction protein B
MINKDKLHSLIEQYKKDFASFWEDERYKWVAVKHFQDRWNIDAEDFASMFENSTKDVANLLASMNYFPRGMMMNFIAKDKEKVRQMFKDLYNESSSNTLLQRIEAFQVKAEQLRATYGADEWKNHYQDARCVSTYLWLRYPEKYYLFKYSECLALARAIGSSKEPVHGGGTKNVQICYDLFNEIADEIRDDSELRQILNGLLDGDCYPDPRLNTVLTDISHYVKSYYKSKEQKELPAEEKTLASESSDVSYWWLVASPKIWQFANMDVNTEQSYTLYNDNGNKRKIFQNFKDAKAGDIVIGYEANPVKQIVALAEVSKETDGEQIFFKKTESLLTPIPYNEIANATELSNMEFIKKPHGSFFKLTHEEFNFIMDLIRDENPKQKAVDYESYTEKEFLNEVYMDNDEYIKLKSLLLTKQNLILQGAPGVGKTFSAKRLAYSIMGVKDDSKIEVIQFHQNYSYEDFIMGYRPKDDGGFELRHGVFYSFCKKAANDPDHKYFFIIDEINRGNMSKIFGELLMLIEKDYRGAKHEIRLAYNDEKFYVPKNLYILGIMNTADRSLAMIDYALRRRFSFYEMKPGFTSQGFINYQNEIDSKEFDAVINGVINLNSDIEADDSLGSGFCIGHSYFCNQDNDDININWLENVIEYDICPMLREYWFDDNEKYKSESRKLLDILK